ncbi:zf-H2C2 2 domain containing protein [Asbolus verrucosus]|uniref:Zf-H2C2 2 domain containing protein n=1 Tax=Asbolus verrucosus TaxID=1661398 RepID=A0A482VLH0_ASBVE|nr:zf-H2C2 2 domain containing protein [Asbolus verrucosus]
MQLAVDVGAVDRLFECASVQLPPESLICDFCKNEVHKWYSFKQQVLKSMEVAKYIEEHGNKNSKTKSDNYAVIEEYFVKVEADDEFEHVEVKPEIFDVNVEENDEFDASNREEEQVQTPLEQMYKCELCDKVLSTLSGIYYHKKTHTRIKSSTPPLEAAEERLITPLPKQEIEDDNKYQCDLCHKSFISKNGIIWHKQLHSALKLDLSKDSERFPCPYCPMIYEKKPSLIDHMKWKHNRCVKRTRQSTMCDVCGQQCKSKADFKIHMRTHSGEKPYKCETCNRGFITSSNLMSHRKIHTGETPFVCEACGRGFKRQRGLLSHQMIHTEEPPHKCHICNRAFRQKSCLKKHMKSH